MSQWLSRMSHQGFNAVAHTNGAAFTHSNHHIIDMVLLKSDQAPQEVQDYFNSFVGKTVIEWETQAQKKDA